MVYLTLLAGFVLLVAGGEGFVRGAVAIAKRLGMSPLLIGLTLMGFGTSLPELMTSLQAAIDGAPGIAVGNVVGSNIANLFLILGVAAVIFPVPVDKGVLRRDGSVLVLSALACTAVVVVGYMGRIAGLILVALLIGYIVRSYMVERQSMAANRAAEATSSEPKANIWLSLLIAIGGLALTLIGARLLVSSAVELATAFGVSQTVIGLTVVAIGTSLPELVTAVIASFRRHTELALGNIIGSNIFNVFGIMGITALVMPIPVPPEIIRVDIWVMLGATVLALYFAYTQRNIVRWEGGVFLALYAAYVGYLALGI
jgi:cation:H+ antiporter